MLLNLLELLLPTGSNGSLTSLKRPLHQPLQSNRQSSTMRRTPSLRRNLLIRFRYNLHLSSMTRLFQSCHRLTAKGGEPAVRGLNRKHSPQPVVWQAWTKFLTLLIKEALVISRTRTKSCLTSSRKTNKILRLERCHKVQTLNNQRLKTEF